MKNPTKTHVKNPPENLLDLPRFATDLPPICSCGSELWIDACDRCCDDVDWFVTEREKDEYREIDREGEIGYGEIKKSENMIERERERERKRIKTGKMS